MSEPAKNAAAPAKADPERLRFEQWATPRCLSLATRPDGEYASVITNEAWDAFRAALSAPPAAAPPEPTIRERDMAMMIRRLCSHTASQKTREQAMELLCKHGLQGSPLRAAALAAAPTVPAADSEEREVHAELTAGGQFLDWNRAQPEPLVKIAYEYVVFRKAIDLYSAALAASPHPTTAQQKGEQSTTMEPVAWMDPQTLDVIHSDRKAAWESDYGLGGKAKAASYIRALYATPPAALALLAEARDEMHSFSTGTGGLYEGEFKEIIARIDALGGRESK